MNPANGRSIFRLQKEYFQYETYINFLQNDLLPKFWKKNDGRIFLIQDNASYHKKRETYEWFAAHRNFIEVQCLPPYHPELNAAEKLWWYTRRAATHNRYYETEEELRNTLKSTFSGMTKKPSGIKSLVQRYF